MDLIPVPPTKPETKTGTVEQSKETTQEVVEYEFGGFEYEKEAIGIFNDIINWFVSDRVRYNKSDSTNLEDRLSSPGQTIFNGNGTYEQRKDLGST